MEQTKTRAQHTGWREDEIDRLWHSVRQANENGLPLRSVFEEMGEALGRRPNSVRNYYYMQMRAKDSTAARRASPFETFTESEVRALVKAVLRARAQGQSVRACVMALSGGDQSRMLRYQNKYRSTVKKRPELVAEVCRELREEGIDCALPVADVRGAQELRARAEEKARLLGDPDICAVLGGLDALLDRALNNDPQIHRDRMRVQLDMQVLRYDDLARAAGDLLLYCKEFLGQEADACCAGIADFRLGLVGHVTAVENALK